MNIKITALTFFVLFTSLCALGQTTGDYQSHATGSWSAVGSWERYNGTSWITPAPSTPTTTDGVITIQAGHTIQIGSAASADQIVINGTLQVLDNFTLTVSGATPGSAITVNSGGILEKQETTTGATGSIAGTTTTNTVFNSGGIYKHNFTNLSGNPVAATWNLGSEMQIVGYTGTTTPLTIAGTNWGGNFATVRYNCPQANNSIVDFAGLLTKIQQDLIIEGTNSGAATTGRFIFNSTGNSNLGSAINIGRDFSISGRSRVWLETTGSVDVNVTRNFSYNSSIATTSQISGGATGTSNLTIAGTATFSGGNFTIASIAGGIGNLTVNNNSLSFNAGTLAVATAGAGTINVTGGGNFICAGTTLTVATTGTGAINVNNGGGFAYTAGNITYASTGIGQINLNGGGNFVMTSTGTMTFDTGAGAGSLNLAGGSFSAVSGAISDASTTGTGTITFSGATNSTINAAPAIFTVGTVAFIVNKPGGSLKIINNDLTIAGTLTMTSGTLDLNGRTLTLSGAIAPDDWTAAGSSFTTTSPSSLIIQGAFASPATNMAIQDGSSFTTFTLNRANTPNALPTSGNITVTNLNLFNGTLTHTPGALTMANGGLIVRTAAAAILTNPPSAAGTYDVTYNNAAAITAAASFNELPASSTVLRDITIAGVGAVTFPTTLTSLTINRNLIITGTGILTGTANQTVTVGGDFSSNGGVPNFGQAGSTFIFSNTTAFPNSSHSLSGTAAPTFPSLTINGAVTASVGMMISGATTSLIVNSSSNLTANAGTTTFATNPGTTTITNSGTLNLNAVTINTGHTMVAPATTTGIAGNFSTPGTFTANGGTIVFNGSSTQTLSASKVYNNVLVRAGAIVTSAFNQTINGTFKNIGSFTVPTLTLGTSSATTLRSGSTTTITTLTLTAPAAIAANGNLTVSGALTIPNNSSITASDTSSITKGAGNFTVTGPNGSFSSTSTVTFNTGTTTFAGTGAKTFKNIVVTSPGVVTPLAISYRVNGNISGTGTLNAGTGTSVVTFGGSAQAISVTTAGFNNVTINNGSTVTANTPITITGTANPTMVINGAFVHGGQTVKFAPNVAGNSTQTISGNPTTFFNITVGNGTGNVTLTHTLSALKLAGVLNINGATTNTFTTGGSSKFTLLSTTDNSANDASIGPLTGSATLNGALTAQRFVSSEGRIYRYISSPVIGAKVSDWQTSGLFVTGTFTNANNGSTPGCTGCKTNPSAFRFDETQIPPYTGIQPYYAFPTPVTGSNSDPIVNGRGYSVFFRHDLEGALTLSYPGTHPATTGVVLPVAPATNAGSGGYSLVGNPYPSPVIWNNIGWTKSGISDVITVRDNATGIHQVHGTADNFVIAVGQSFWVQSIANGASLQINESAKTSTQSTPGSFYRIDANLPDGISINLTKATTNITDNARIVIQPSSLSSYDQYDGFKFNNNIDNGTTVTEVQDISTLSSDSKALGLNAIPNVVCGQKYKIKVTNFLNTGETLVNYSISITPSGGLKALRWMLHDSLTNTSIDLTSTPNYSFQVDNSNALSKSPNRFYITPSSPSAINTSSIVTAATSVCTGTDAVIKVASQPGMTYAVEVNGLLLPFNAQGNGNDISIFIPSDTLATTNTVRVKVNSGCDQQFLTQTVQFSTENFATAQANNVYRCSPGSVTLTATGAPTQGNYNWYAASTGGSPLFTGASFVTPALTDTTIYYVAALNNTGCEGNRVAVEAQIGNNGNSLVISQPQTICSGTQGYIVATGAPSGGSYRWYNGPDASATLLGQSDTLKQILYKPIKFYLSSVDAQGCEGNRIEFMTNVIKFYPTISTSFLNGAICKTGTQTVSAISDVTSTTYRWYSSANSVLPLTEDLTFTTPTISASTDYYVSAVSVAGCESPRQIFTVTVNTSDPSANLTFQTSTICSGGGTSILASAGNNISYINWYESPTSTAPFTNTNEFDTPLLNGARYYYASAVDQSGCEGTKKTANVNVVSLDSAKITVDPLKITVTNYATGIQWYLNGDLLASETNPTIVPKLSGDYTLVISSQGCTTSKDVVFSITAIEEELTSSIVLYPNPASTEINITNSGVDSVDGQIFDMTGRQLKILNISGGQTIKVETYNLSSGMYIFKFSSEKGVSFKKAIIK